MAANDKGKPKTQSTGIFPGQFQGIPPWRVSAGSKSNPYDPVLESFGRSDYEVASERTPDQNKATIAQNKRLRSHSASAPRRRDPEIAKRTELVRSNLDLSAQELCELLDHQSVPLPLSWQAAGFKKWTQAHKNAQYRGRIDVLFSKARGRS
jgi:hypothetical protein